jgi:hypothetical protein
LNQEAGIAEAVPAVVFGMWISLHRKAKKPPDWAAFAFLSDAEDQRE